MLYFKVKKNTIQSRKMAEYLKTLSYIEVIDVPNSGTIEAINDAREKKVNKYKDSKELFRKLKE